MKFSEYIERSIQAKQAAHLLLLIGEDTLLKEVIIEHLGKLIGLWASRERFEINDIRSVAGLWEEGSLMGPRFLDLRVKSKPRNSKLWKSFLSQVSSSENYMTVVFEKEEPDWTGVLSRPIFQVVDCKFPRTSKERTKLVNLRLKMNGCNLDPAMAKELAGRVKSVAELESSVTTLSLLSKTMDKITEREITYVAGEAEQFSNTARAILLGNNLVLLEEVETKEPLLLLGSWHATFKKLYCWINQLTSEDEKQEPEEESEDDTDETPEEVQGLKVSRYQLKDYNVARKRYSQTLIRAIMEDINAVYQDVRIGREGGWEERVRFIVSKMPTK